MSRSKPICLICVATALLAAELAALPQQLPPGRWWERPGIARELGITPEQRERLNEAAFAHARRLADLQAAVRKAEIDVGEAADAEPFDAAAARRTFDALLEARAEMARERFEIVLAVRRTLTREQWTRVREMAAERRRGLLERPRPR